MTTRALRSSRPKQPDGWHRGLCRRCGAEVQGRRRTFCSQLCVDLWLFQSSPAEVRRQVFLRDHGVCSLCGLDTETLAPGRNLGGRRSHWDADHTVPLVEGGANDMSNIRTLCRRCHRAETAALRRRLAAARRPTRTPSLQLELQLELA